MPELRSRFLITVATADTVRPVQVARVKFRIAQTEYEELFLIMSKMTGPIIGNSFIKKHGL